MSQARILQWIVISSSRRFSWPRDWTHIFCIGRQILYQLNYLLPFFLESSIHYIFYMTVLIILWRKKTTYCIYHLEIFTSHSSTSVIGGTKKKKRRPPIFKGIIVKMNPTHKMIQLKLNQVIFVKCSALCLACNKCSKKMLPALVTVLTTQRCSACSESNDSFTWSLLTERWLERIQGGGKNGRTGRIYQ